MGCALGDHVTTICFSSSAISTLASHLPRLYTPHPCLPRPPPRPATLPPLATPPTAHPHHTTPSSTNLNWRRRTATFTPVTSSSQPIVSHHPLGGAPAVLLAVLNLPPPPGRPLPLALPLLRSPAMEPPKTRYPSVGELVSDNGGGGERQAMGSWAAACRAHWSWGHATRHLIDFAKWKRGQGGEHMFMVSLGGHTT